MKILMQGAIVVAVAAALYGATAHAQTDVALSGFRTMTSSSSGGGTQQTPHDSEGGIIELRHIVNPLVGFEGAVSFNPDNQSFAPETGACGFVCGLTPQEVSGKLTEFTLDWVVSMKAGKVRPFALGGVGFAFTVPGRNPTVTTPNRPVPGYSVTTVVRPVFVYGGGLDYSFTKRFGLRVQFRGNMTKAPDLRSLYVDNQVHPDIRADGRDLLSFLVVHLRRGERFRGGSAAHFLQRKIGRERLHSRNRTGCATMLIVLPLHYGVSAPGLPFSSGSGRRRSVQVIAIPRHRDSGSKQTNAAAGTVIINAHCESGSPAWDGNGRRIRLRV